MSTKLYYFILLVAMLPGETLSPSTTKMVLDSVVPAQIMIL